jgi:integrase
MRERERPEFWPRERPDGTHGKTLWTNLGGKRVSTGCTNLKTAKRWKERKLVERADPRRAASEAARLDDAMRELYAELRRRGRSAGTQKKCREKLAHFPRLWGADCKLSEIDARKVSKYIDTRLDDPGQGGNTVSRLTIRDELGFLRQMLKLARRQGLYAYAIDDVMPLQWETGHKPKKDWCTPSALEKLLEHVIPRHAAHLLFFVTTAGRRADSYRALRSDFDVVKWRATVRGSKTDGSFRTIPITDFLRPFVTRMLALAEGEEILFPMWTNIARDMREACDRAGIPRVSTNGLRRTFGKWHRLRGYSLDLISKLFGHTTAKLARDVYADVDGDELAEVLALEGAIIRSKSGTGEELS